MRNVDLRFRIGLLCCCYDWSAMLVKRLIPILTASLARTVFSAVLLSVEKVQRLPIFHKYVLHVRALGFNQCYPFNRTMERSICARMSLKHSKHGSWSVISARCGLFQIPIWFGMTPVQNLQCHWNILIRAKLCASVVWISQLRQLTSPQLPHPVEHDANTSHIINGIPRHTRFRPGVTTRGSWGDTCVPCSRTKRYLFNHVLAKDQIDRGTVCNTHGRMYILAIRCGNYFISCSRSSFYASVSLHLFSLEPWPTT